MEAQGTGAFRPQRECGVVRHAGQVRVNRGRPLGNCQRHERRGRGDDRVPEPAGDVEPGAVAAALGERLAPGRQDDGPRVDGSTGGLDAKATALGFDGGHPRAGAQVHAGAIDLGEERLEHVTRALAVGEELPVFLGVQRHADPGEEGDRVADGEAAKDAPDNRAAAAGEVAFRDDLVGDVAARPAADENLGAWPDGAVEEHDRRPRIEPSREDGGCEPRGAGADDDEVGISAPVPRGGTPRPVMLEAVVELKPACTREGVEHGWIIARATGLAIQIP